MIGLPGQLPKRRGKAIPDEPTLIVGIGASAGGLESVSALLKELPADTGMSFVVVQHLDPRQISHMTELLGKVTPLPVVEIYDKLIAQPDCVYVLQPGQEVRLEGGAFSVRSRVKRGGIDGQIDFFLMSLAQSARARAVGIVLSGTGSDGSRGIREIKQNGGLTFAESQRSAKYFGMPQSAIASGAVDLVLTPANIARKLARIAHKAARNGDEEMAPDKPGRNLTALEKIFEILRESRRVDFTHYKHSTIRRRIARRMASRRIGDLKEYADLLSEDAKEADDLFKDLLINVTGFFRNTPAFQALAKQLLPKIIADNKGIKELRVWVPGCATGEEVYSIAIVVHETLSRLKMNLTVQIFGTDISESTITRARAGIYPASISRDISPERLKRFFIRKDGNYQIGRMIRDTCTFAEQNLCEDPPFSRLDLISCRNVLIYFGTDLQRKCVPLFYYALNPHGYLMLGNSETIGGFADLFSLVDKKNKIYRKKVAAGSSGGMLKDWARRNGPPSDRAPGLPLRPKSPRDLLKPNALDVQTAADQLILTHFAPCGVVVDPKLQVWHFRGATGPFLRHAPGLASLNLLKMVHHDIAADLSAAIHQAIKSGNGVRKEVMILNGEKGSRNVQLEVIPFNVRSSSEQWFLIIFESWTPTAQPAIRGKSRRSRAEAGYVTEITRLRSDLASTKESLQAIIEEQEAANEEIKSANEEIESSNEELQSANEELETAKEELQSTNEELTTVNDELNNRNQEISLINSDLNDLLNSIHIAVVLVDNSLTIRRATPLAEKLLNIIPSDMGRKLSDINPNLEIPALPKMIRGVIEHLTPCEQTVRDREGNAYSLRVRPYRTKENLIEGVVISLIDINGSSNTGLQETVPPQH